MVKHVNIIIFASMCTSMMVYYQRDNILFGHFFRYAIDFYTEFTQKQKSTSRRRRLANVFNAYNTPSSTALKVEKGGAALSPPSSEMEMEIAHARSPAVGQEDASQLLKRKISIYNLEDALSMASLYESEVGVLIYNPSKDKFVAYCNKGRILERNKLVGIIKTLAYDLRHLYPGQFNSDGTEFALPLGWGHSPPITKEQRLLQRYDSKSSAPILQFGSTFKHSTSPEIIAMPMPQSNHLSCFHNWVVNQGVICPSYSNGIFDKEIDDIQWKDLIPQVVWRGGDDDYLPHLQNLRKPDFDMDIGNKFKMNSKESMSTASIEAMRTIYDQLVPRWKGVVLTAEAERDANRSGGRTIPWANIKFTTTLLDGKLQHTSELKPYTQFQEHGIPAIGEEMSIKTHAQYKYHIDLGGSDGTSWTGTLRKLVLPGLLFHHETPTKNYIHEMMKPWVHYVPIKSDLTNLKEMYEWAETHQEEAQEISERATSLAKRFGTRDGFQSTFNTLYEQPLGEVVNAYQPLADNSWEHIINKHDSSLVPLVKCGGHDQDEPCEVLSRKQPDSQSPNANMKKEANKTMALASSSTTQERDDSLMQVFENNLDRRAIVVDAKVEFRSMRDEAVKLFHSWSNVRLEVESTGHPWCSLYRDNYVCTGDRYKKVLRQTPLFDHSFSFNAFPPNSTIYIEGNSWMGQLIATVTCNSNVDQTWMLSGKADNSMYVRINESNITVVSIINHHMQVHPERIVAMLRDLSIVPDIVVRGTMNDEMFPNHNFKPKVQSEAMIPQQKALAKDHERVFISAFPKVPYIDWSGRRLPTNCEADFTNCKEKAKGHTCLPGPVNSFAQDLTKAMLSVMK